jgi:PAS domain S-box-containing protein
MRKKSDIQVKASKRARGSGPQRFRKKTSSQSIYEAHPLRKRGRPAPLPAIHPPIEPKRVHEVEEHNLRLGAAIESAADAVVITDTRGIIRYVNPAFERITGYAKKEALGRDLHILDGARHDAAFYREVRETIRRDGVWKGLLVNKKKDGTIYSEDCTYSPIKNASGFIINYLSIKRDVTEKLWLESIAQSVDTMNNIGYIFAGVRHEIGNPVNAAAMIIEVLKSKLPRLEKPAIEGYLDRAIKELHRVEYLLRTLKSYNMYETPHLQKINVADFMDKFLSVVREDFKMKGIRIEAAIGEHADFFYADPRALQQILLNFLANSADALEGRDNQTIALQVFKKTGMIRIRVEDNGCGMTPGEQKSLFKPFYTTKPKGTGLGLVIVKKMLTMMQGTVEIRSEKNIGTAVDIAVLDGSEREQEPCRTIII